MNKYQKSENYLGFFGIVTFLPGAFTRGGVAILGCSGGGADVFSFFSRIISA